MIRVEPPETSPPQPDIDSEYDVVIIGAGPAGATAGALLAEHGRKTLILERAIFPRFHLGESLIPETYWSLERLGLLDELRKSAFPKKFSVQFVSDGHKISAPFYFDQHNPHECSQTWQVERGPFDKMILDKAISNGATAHTEAQVLDVLFEGDQAVGVKVKIGKGQTSETREIAAKVVIDATGQSAFLANRLGLLKKDDRLQKGTIWSYFRGAVRDTGVDEGATIIMQTAGKKSWFWYIPLPDDIVSVGCTGSMNFLFGQNRGTPEEIFQEELSRCPAMQDRLEPSEPHTDYFTTKDFSYRASQAAGPGWVIIGDAFGFIDPVYSSGVFLALKSGELAADAIHAAIEQNDVSQAALSGWVPGYAAGLELFRKLVYAFYTPGFSFGKFLKEFPQYRENLVDILIGNVFRPGVGEMFDHLEDVVPPSDIVEESVSG